MLTREEVTTGLAESSGLRGRVVTKSREPGLYGVELPDTRHKVSNTAQDSSLLTSMVMLIWLSALGGRALVGLVAGEDLNNCQGMGPSTLAPLWWIGRGPLVGNLVHL